MSTATQTAPGLVQGLIAGLEASRDFFNRSTECLAEEHGQFVPQEGLMTAAQHVAHVAQTVDWFLEGAFRPEGFNLDFESGIFAPIPGISLADARQRLEDSYDRALAKLKSVSEDELRQSLPEGPVMGGQPRLAIFAAIEEHTAHHRGALTVYSRLAGLSPKMPYGDM